VPLQLPVLDDRRFDDLAAEGRALVPTFAPDWTNHNPSDPGIILLELFAHLTEMLVYRLDRITTADVAVFLNLLDGKQRDAGALAGTDVAAEIRGTIQALRTLDRAIRETEQHGIACDLESVDTPGRYDECVLRCERDALAVDGYHTAALDAVEHRSVRAPIGATAEPRG